MGMHADIKVQVNSQVAYDCGWRYEIFAHTDLRSVCFLQMKRVKATENHYILI